LFKFFFYKHVSHEYLYYYVYVLVTNLSSMRILIKNKNTVNFWETSPFVANVFVLLYHTISFYMFAENSDFCLNVNIFILSIEMLPINGGVGDVRFIWISDEQKEHTPFPIYVSINNPWGTILHYTQRFCLEGN